MEKISCAYCGEEKRRTLMRSCSHCGRVHCINHNLPARHECPSAGVNFSRSLIGAETHSKETRMKNIVISTSKAKKEAKKKSKEKGKQKGSFLDWLKVNIALALGWNEK